MDDKFKLDFYIKNGYVIKLIHKYENGATIHLLGPNLEKIRIITYDKSCIKFAQFAKANQINY